MSKSAKELCELIEAFTEFYAAAVHNDHRPYQQSADKDGMFYGVVSFDFRNPVFQQRVASSIPYALTLVDQALETGQTGLKYAALRLRTLVYDFDRRWMAWQGETNALTEFLAMERAIIS